MLLSGQILDSTTIAVHQLPISPSLRKYRMVYKSRKKLFQQYIFCHTDANRWRCCNKLSKWDWHSSEKKQKISNVHISETINSKTNGLCNNNIRREQSRRQTIRAAKQTKGQVKAPRRFLCATLSTSRTWPGPGTPFSLSPAKGDRRLIQPHANQRSACSSSARITHATARSHLDDGLDEEQKQ